jgi:hypothetical protein
VSGFVAAGEHRVVWDGRNDTKVAPASAVYFIRLQTVDFIETQKMTLLK